MHRPHILFSLGSVFFLLHLVLSVCGVVWSGDDDDEMLYLESRWRNGLGLSCSISPAPVLLAPK